MTWQEWGAIGEAVGGVAVLNLHEKGLIDDARTGAWIDDSLGLVTTPGGREWWEATKHVFVPKVSQLLDARLADPSGLPGSFTEHLPFFRDDPRGGA